MRFVVIAAALVAGFLGLASCQMDCALPDNSDIAVVLSGVLRSGDSSSTPVINVIGFTPRCLAVSAQRDRFRYFSVLVEYTCTGHSLCPDEGVTAREQIESECAGQVWNNRVLGSTVNTRETNVTDPPISVPTRQDCAVCASPTISANVIGQESDDIYHCVACMGCSENPGQNACTDLNPDACCNVYVYDSVTDKYVCDTGCTGDGTFVIDPDTFMCLITCDDLGNNVVNGAVRYSTPIEQADGRYRQNTTATVTCDTGFRGGGDITCERSGEWSAPLPTCEPAVDCGDPPTLDNGKLTVSPPASTLLGSVVTYECNNGYVFEGSDMTRTCLNTGEWSDEDIRCELAPKECEPPCKNGGTCNTVEGVCECPMNLVGELCECPIEGCDVCEDGDDGKPTCVTCQDDFERDDAGNECKRISGGSSTCIPCIVVPLAVILAALAVAAVIAAFVYYRWKKAPSTKLKEKDAEGINGVARDNPLYLDPATVAEEAEE